MTIKQQGGVFGRNPTFNDVDIEGTLTVNGEPISDFGTMAQQDADSVNIDGGAIDGAVIGGSTPAAVSGTTGNFSTSTQSETSGIVRAVNTYDLSADRTTEYANLTLGRAGVTALYNPVYAWLSTYQYSTDGNANSALAISVSPTSANSRAKVMDIRATGTIFYSTTQGSGTTTARMRIEDNGNIRISNGNLVLNTAGTGIDFSATSGTGTSELFDDYEEGTWTPAFTPTGTDFSSITYDTQSGHYTKVGRLVTVTGFIRTDAITIGSASGSVLISGLPYAATSAAVGSVGGTYNWGGDVPLSVTVFNTSTELYMYYRTSVNGIDSAIAPSDMGTGANNNDIYFTISYMAS